MPQVRFMDGFDEGRALGAIDCADGGGRIDRYELFDGVTVMRVSLQTHGFEGTRRKRDGLEINFCASGRFESSFSSRDQAALTPGDLAVSTFDGTHGARSESRFPLGHYEGVCIDVDCAAAARWMRKNAAPLATDFSALRENLLGGRWYVAMSAGPCCEHVFRELFENMPYFDRAYLQLKVLELFMLLGSVPRVEPAEADYCSAEHLRLIRHLRDHLVSDRGSYVSLARLAEEHGISVSHLQKLFCQVYGAPVYHYIREYRLEQAAVELTRGEKRIVDVALDAGYDSPSKFSAAFKVRYRITPSDYRAAADVSKRSSQTRTD